MICRTTSLYDIYRSSDISFSVAPFYALTSYEIHSRPQFRSKFMQIPYIAISLFFRFSISISSFTITKPIGLSQLQAYWLSSNNTSQSHAEDITATDISVLIWHSNVKKVHSLFARLYYDILRIREGAFFPGPHCSFVSRYIRVIFSKLAWRPVIHITGRGGLERSLSLMSSCIMGTCIASMWPLVFTRRSRNTVKAFGKMVRNDSCMSHNDGLDGRIPL